MLAQGDGGRAVALHQVRKHHVSEYMDNGEQPKFRAATIATQNWGFEVECAEP
jgi:hypothetical protein